MPSPFNVKHETSLSGSSDLGTGRADYTTDIVTNVDVTVQAERLASVIKSSSDIPETEYSSGWLGTGDYNKLVGIMFSNQGATIYIEQSIDGETVYSRQTQSYSASSVNPAEATWSYELTAPYARLRVEPASTPTTFTVWTRLSNGA